MRRLMVVLAVLTEVAAFGLAVQAAGGPAALAGLSFGAAVLGELVQGDPLTGDRQGAFLFRVLADAATTMAGGLILGEVGGWMVGKVAGAIVRAATRQAGMAGQGA